MLDRSKEVINIGYNTINQLKGQYIGLTDSIKEEGYRRFLPGHRTYTGLFLTGLTYVAGSPVLKEVPESVYYHGIFKKEATALLLLTVLSVGCNTIKDYLKEIQKRQEDEK